MSLAEGEEERCLALLVFTAAVAALSQEELQRASGGEEEGGGRERKIQTITQLSFNYIIAYCASHYAVRLVGVTLACWKSRESG